MARVRSFVIAAVVLLAMGASAQTPAPRSEAVAKAGQPVVNLNSATLVELQSLPGIGEKVAARIIDYRMKKGPFRKIEEIMNVQGIGEKSFLKLRSQLTVSAKPEPAAQP